MRYSIVAETYDSMEKTTKRLELTDILSKLFEKTPAEVIDKVVYLTQGKLYPDYKGVEIGIAEKLAMKAISLSSGAELSGVEKEYAASGDLGVVALKFSKNMSQSLLFPEPLTVERIHEALDKMAKTTGSGTVELKIRSLASLLSDSTPLEAKYIMRTVMAELRLGIADYTVLDALSIAFTKNKENRELVERAYNISSDLGLVARTLALRGLEGLKEFKVQPGRPVRPMLAERLETAKEILEKLGGKAAAEYKLDGERLQIHKKGKDMKIFSRRLEDITPHYPDAIELCLSNVKGKDWIIEGEAVAVNIETGEYLPFQELMHRRRKHGIEEAMQKYPISLNVFDVLFLDGKDLTSTPYSQRRKELERTVKDDKSIRAVPMTVATQAKEIEDFMEQAIIEGCEGLVVKDNQSNYRAGAREFAWIKLKREYRSELTDTLDLVIIGAFYGRGRRAGKYGAFLLGSYDKANDTFRSVSKIGTGFTDEDLERFLTILEPFKLSRRDSMVDSKLEADVWFTPKVVIEAVASEITLSPIYTASMDEVRKGSGLALRFPKFTGRIRDDKAPEDCTTDKELIEMYRRQLRKIEKAEQAGG